MLLKSCASDRDLGHLLLPDRGGLSLISIKLGWWPVTPVHCCEGNEAAVAVNGTPLERAW